ncbi:glutamate decarboxylase [Amblyomma americanum]
MAAQNRTEDVSALRYTDLYPFRDDSGPTHEFLRRVFDILWAYVEQQQDRSSKILDFHMPEELMQILDLDLPQDPQPLQRVLADCAQALKYQVRTGHPHFFNQLSSGLDIVSLAGEWLCATANTNMFTYEIAPVFILMENVVMQKMRELIGYTNGDSILAPGGSVSNLYAVLAARHKMFPNYKTLGLKALPQLVMYTSEDSHYSVKGAGATIGLGTDNVVSIPVDKCGRMMVDVLEKEIQASKARGHVPFFVNCTAGSTVIGAFDPIHPIADICQRHGLWLHVDAAWGGGCLLSKKHRHLLDGIERSDSVTWNPHKLMGTHLQCSTIHLKEDGLLLSCNQMCAEYLFQQDKHYDVSFDTGDKVPQCGRHNDIFKLWLMWRAKGTVGFERLIDHLFDMSNYLVQKIKERPDMFYLLLEPELVNVCFWYIPKRLRGKPHNKEKEQELGVVTAQLKARMMNTGTLMITYQPIWDKPNFFRNIVSNSGVRREDIDFLVEELDRLGHDL